MLAIAVAKHLDLVVPNVTFDEAGVTGNTFIATVPSSPDAVIAITPSGGAANRTLQPDDFPSLQVRCRGPRFDPRPGYATARAIYEALNGLDNITLDQGGEHEVRVVGCTAVQSDPASIGVDENDRHEWVVNLDFHVHAPTTHRS